MRMKNRLNRLARAVARRHPPRNPLEDLTDEELDKEVELLGKVVEGIPLDAAERARLALIQARPHCPSHLDEMTEEELHREIKRLKGPGPAERVRAQDVND